MKWSAALFVFLLMFMASFKTALATAVPLPDFAVRLKLDSVYAAGLLAVIMAVTFLPPNRLEFRQGGILLAMICLRITSFARSVAVDFQTSLAELGPAVLTLAIYYFANSYVQRFGRRQYLAGTGQGLLLFSLFFIAVNLLITVQGYGFYYAASVRAQGMTVHPNALGFECGLYASVIWYYIIYNFRLRKLILLLPFLVAAAGLLFLSGSRNGMLIAMIACGTILWLRLGLKLHASTLIAVCLVVFGIAFLAATAPSMGDLLAGTPLERSGGGSQDSRSETWGLMFDTVMEHPFLGAGQINDAGGSENSYLRGWADFGIIYFIMLCGVIVTLLKRLIGNAKRAEAVLFLGLAGGLAFGGMFDGQLIDRLSGVMMVFIIVASVSVPNRAAARRLPAGSDLSSSQRVALSTAEK